MTGGIIIIGGGGNVPMSADTPYLVAAGDQVQNTATSGPDAVVVFTPVGGSGKDIVLPPGHGETLTQAGMLVLL